MLVAMAIVSIVEVGCTLSAPIMTVSKIAPHCAMPSGMIAMQPAVLSGGLYARH